ncbi:MAG: FIVAR domain-containing protein, partial [Clostridiales Family XIII bacterium]|nr:FIVAR domain-containing protein [Clostridiales Family XIII bacterium]
DPNVAGSYTFTATLGSLPANFLNGGGYTATIEVVVGVFVNKAVISGLISSVEEVFGIDGLGIHEDNYVNLQVEAFVSALASAKAIVANPDATQADVDTALALLEAAYGALVHDHPVLSNSHSGGLLAFGEDVEIEIKGDFRDVTAFSLNCEAYELSQGEGDVLIINEDGEGEIGTITKGSAIVNLPAEFSDRLENGTHYVSVTFADSYDQKAGTASIVVNRVENEELVPPTSSPNTGDNVPIGLYGTFISSLMLLIGLLIYRRRLTSQVHVGK